MTTDSIFAAARKTDHMVDRVKELDTLNEAICSAGTETRLVIVRGDGGMGKTRLLNEAFVRATGHLTPHHGADEKLTQKISWQPEQKIIVANLLDFTNVRLHTFQYFISALRQAFICDHHPGADFTNYDRARDEHQRWLDQQADHRTIERTRAGAQEIFFENYNAVAANYRLVWLLDTAEQLNIPITDWLKDILTPEDLNVYTQQRLLDLLREGKLPNTTIILAGRQHEAQKYFDLLTDEKNGANSQYQVIDIKLENFSLADTKDYLAELAKNWQQQEPDSHIAAYLKEVTASHSDRADVLWLYTGGQPVRLALYTDILTEGKSEPTALQETLAEARERVGWNKITHQADPDKLKQVQFEIEDEFVNLIFAKTRDLRPQILRILVQARRGLGEHRLHFILDALPDTEIESWVEDQERLEEIRGILNEMRSLSFVKTTPEGRLILQDEMYRIYDEHACADPTSQQDEMASRQALYQQLLTFVERDIERLTQQKIQNREDDERTLRWESPARALSLRFGFLSETQIKERSDLNRQLLEANLEKLHYELRINPDIALNDVYYDLAEQRWLANDLEADAQIQIEVWRVLNDRFIRKFIQLQPREDVTEQEELWAGLQRLIEQENVVRWLKRFVFSARYRRAIEFAEQAETIIAGFPKEKGTLGWSLKHTFSSGERICWEEFARIVIGQDALKAIGKLEETVGQLKRLLEPTGIPERNEGSFLGHPAEIRLSRVIGVIYGSLGIGYAYQGQYRRASDTYTKALHYFRETSFSAQKAVTLNDLSRALSETGRRTRAVRICQDSLEIRKKLAAESSIAYSYNTLALIHNNNLQPDYAWPEAAKAIVHFRRLGDLRGLGLSLLQFGEALRRLAFVNHPLIAANDTPEELLATAESAILEALDIFTQSEEVMRQIEAEIEIGSLYRDYMRYLKSQKAAGHNELRWQRFRHKALQYFDEAISRSKAHNYPYHRLDAQVNLAWTHYSADEFTQVEQVSDQILAELADKPFMLKRNTSPPKPENINETYAFVQLGKLWVLKGRLAFDQFQLRTQTIKKEHRNKSEARQIAITDQEINLRSRQAAEAFVLSLGYAQLFSVRSPNLNIAFDILYNYLKTFNVSEMEMFYKYVQVARQSYQVADIKSENLADVGQFLLQSFGDYFRSEIGGEI